MSKKTIPAAVALAEELLDSDITERREPFEEKIRDRQGQLAARGIGASGAALKSYADECKSEIRERAVLAERAIERAIEAAGVAFSPTLAAELDAAFDRIFSGRWTDVIANFYSRAQEVGIDVDATKTKFEKAFTLTSIAASTKAKAQLHIFAARLRYQRDRGWRETLQRIAYIVVGAVITKVPEWASSLIGALSRLFHANVH